MKATISCTLLPNNTTQSSRNLPKQRGVTARSLTFGGSGGMVTLTETLGGRRKDSTTSPAGDGLPAAQLELQHELERQQELEPEAWWPTCLATVLRDSRRGRKCEKVKFSSPSHRLMRSLALVWGGLPRHNGSIRGSPTIVVGPGRPKWLN